MQLLYSWLKQFLEISLPPQALARELTAAGIEVTNTTRVEGDWLLAMEVTPNRPDLLSHLGLAREVAAILGRPFHLRKKFVRELGLLPFSESDFSVEIADLSDCSLYVGILISGVQVKESPPEAIQRLKALGMKPINNIVDATNLCLLELGQPLHAFDRDRMEGTRITVRRAQSKETLATIDGATCTLTPEQLVIADSRRPVALAGVMGGRDTQITRSTKNIFLESARFSPSCVRRGRILAKLESESSYRFERGVDPAMVSRAAYRTARLILELAGGKISGGPITAGGWKPSRRTIRFSPKKAQENLGVPLAREKQQQFLTRLGCQVTPHGTEFKVVPPSWRADLKIAQDLHEELARLWGYERIPATLPPLPRRPVSSGEVLWEDPGFFRANEIRRFLVSCGLREIVTHSLVHPEDHTKVNFMVGGTTLSLHNPLSIECSILRQTLLIGALKTLALNFNRKTESGFQFFELGRVYQGASSGFPQEERMLGILVAGAPSAHWGRKPEALDPFLIKGILAALGNHVGMEMGPEVCGWVDPLTLASFEIPGGVNAAYAELNLEPLLAKAPFQPPLGKPLAKIPPVARDIALLVSQGTPHAAIHDLFLEAGAPLLQEAALFDLYKGPQVPAGKKSMAFRLLFSAGDRTLRDEEVNAAYRKIVSVAQERFQASVR